MYSVLFATSGLLVLVVGLLFVLFHFTLLDVCMGNITVFVAVVATKVRFVSCSVIIVVYKDDAGCRWPIE